MTATALLAQPARMSPWQIEGLSRGNKTCKSLSFCAALALLGGTFLAGSGAGFAQERGPGLSHYGVPGYVDMPSAYALPDGTFAFSVNQYGGDIRRAAMVFQISPRVTGTFRYAYLDGYLMSGGSLYDRSFDLRLQMLTEDPSGWRPAVTVGVQDFGGTGIFASEYIVASKRFSKSVTGSLGLGWGRFGSHGSFKNPLSALSDKFNQRPGFTGIADTGKVDFDRFFRGDTALFAGIDWQASDRLRVSVEYSSDAQVQEVRRNLNM